MRWSKSPVILIGHGIRAAGAAHLAPELLKLGVPVLASWQAKDLVDNSAHTFYGCPGIYGNRAANKVFAHADEILAIGNRMAIWNVGYEGPRKNQRIVMVDVEEAEARKFPHAELIRLDAKLFIERLMQDEHSYPEKAVDRWIAQCAGWKAAHPWVESPTHDYANGYINAWRFVDRMQKYLRDDEIIVTDMGTPLVAAHQVLKIKPPQRLMTSGGLGEMGCALPAAIGASFARNKGRVVCLHADGGMMLNLQELQTIMHHKLPVKIIVFRNESYLMIRHTQKASGMRESGVSASSGVSFPSYRHLALAFGITAGEIRSWDDYERLIPALLSCEGPCLLEYFMDPRQPLVPKLGYEFSDGAQRYAPFDRMSPILEEKEISWQTAA